MNTSGCIHIRHSKSDSILLSTSQSFYQFEVDNIHHQPQQVHRSSVYGWPSNRLQSFEAGTEEESFYNNSCSVNNDATVAAAEEQNSLNTAYTTMLTIEGLRNHYNSCFTCGVSWQEDHVSLDCSECGGYAMQRPCPRCDGQCESTWTRDLAATHKSHKAKWEGDCKMFKNNENQILHGLLQSGKLSAETCDSLLAKALDHLTTSGTTPL